MRKGIVSAVVGVLLLCVGIVSLAAQGGDWKEYVYTADGVAVSSPVEPVFSAQSAQSPGGPVELHQYGISQPGDSGFMLIAGELNDSRSPEQILDDGKRGAVSAVKGRLTGEERISLSGYPGMKITVETEKYHAQARFYVVGRRLYQLYVVAPAGVPFPEGTERFYSSFRLLQNSK